MGFRNLYLKKAYSSDEDNLLDDFYIPILKNSIEYKRIAGFFSSTSLAVAARGIIELIKNNGQVQMLVSPKLYKRDIEVLQETKENHEKYVEKNMLISLEKIEDQFVADHLFALGWMVANQKLEIRIAILYDENGDLMSYEDIDNKGIFHQKVGILIDHDGDYISFSGSINETASAWVENLEEFKVFRSWNASENDYVQEDIKKFNRYWNNNSRLVRVINIPDAVKKRLLEFSPPVLVKRFCNTTT